MNEGGFGEEKMLSTLPAFLVLFVRGLALWVLIPFAVLFWLLAWPWLVRYSKSL